MPEQGYTQTISTSEFTETPSVMLEQPVGDVYVEGWDRPEIQVSISDEGIFGIEQEGSQVVIKNRPGKFKLVDFLEEAGVELRELGVDLGRVTSRIEKSVERGVERNVERNLRRMGRNFNFNIDLSNWKGGRDYRIMVPHNCDLTLRTSTGDMEIHGVVGTLFVQSSSGDIKAHQIGGSVLVTSASGDITIQDLDGRLAMRSASGDIRARNARLDEVSANTASGDVELDLTRLPEGSFDARTVSGNLNLFVPQDSAFQAEIHTLSGSVRCGFPRNVVEYGSKHKRETTLKVNGGGKFLPMNTVSGDVTIRPRRSNDQPSVPGASTSSGSAAGMQSGSPTIRTEGACTMDLSRNEDSSRESARVDASHGDITQSEGYAARQQAELEILQQVERGELTPQEALARLSSLDSD
ncbi:MAG: DUF4097 family beta strand repeat-containing protein [Chloroflexota bacterium]